jgi:hypothetical protein
VGPWAREPEHFGSAERMRKMHHGIFCQCTYTTPQHSMRMRCAGKLSDAVSES